MNGIRNTRRLPRRAFALLAMTQNPVDFVMGDRKGRPYADVHNE